MKNGRRQFIVGGATLAGAALSSVGLRGETKPPASRAFRIAHVTDTHAEDIHDCPRKLQRFVEALAAIDPRPDLLIHTGDIVNEAMAGRDRANVDHQWAIWRAAADSIRIPIRYCIG